MKKIIKNLKQMFLKQQLMIELGNRQKSSGFTLLELLVVIAIISILVTVGMTSFSTAQKKGRDAKRKNDMKEMQAALEQYYSVCGYTYPTPPAGSFYSPVICTAPSIAIMPTIISDPRGITPYYCGGTCNATGYTVCAGLEAESPATFCVTNTQ